MAKDVEKFLFKNLESTNIAKDMDDAELVKIADQVVSGYEIDEESREEWKKQTEEGIKIAEQVVEHKTYPWPNASNVKFPLIAISAIQFAARAYPSIIQGDRVVKTQVTGKDTEGNKAKRAARVSKHMSYQLLHGMEGWEEDTDKLLHSLPVVGTLFRKTFHSNLLKEVVSETCSPLDVVVHMKTKNFKKCRRKTHLVPLYRNEVIERERDGLFIDNNADYMIDDEEDLAEVFLEQHRWLDLDDDGYQEPYIVTVHQTSGTLVRIVACYDQEGVELNDAGKVKRITQVQYFTPFFFIPAASGKFYALGFAHLLGPINESINTTINQLLDAGHLSNVQGGFLGRGIRMKGGNLSFKPGEWKTLDVTGGTLKDNIVPMPVKEPSNVLFQLLGMLNDTGMKLASVSDTMAGETPSQNTPATTTLAVIEQGLKVFTAIYKRVFRSLGEEFQKIQRLNSIHLEDEVYFRVLDEENVIGKDDYAVDDFDVIPVADPSLASDAQRLARAQALYQTLADNPSPEGRLEIMRQFYEALQVENIEKILPIEQIKQQMNQPPPPDPDALKLQLEATNSKHEEERKRDLLPLEMELLESKIEETKARTKKNLADANSKPIMDSLTALNAQVSALQADTKLEIERQKGVIKESANGQTNSTGGSGGDPSGGAGGMAGSPNNQESTEIPEGMPGVSGDPAIDGSNPVIEELGGDGITDGGGSIGDTGTQPYPDDTTRS